ncbi:hypothetical protein RRG08_040819 [Elysia crispata]|uniref:Uncharacterized protein n=1 Tax=Elysia crispata TaxID=231223 RepID=A0AAE1DD72_9GAST|nr:hypothetical protein RRG08_040819 [Elysia crispata]
MSAGDNAPLPVYCRLKEITDFYILPPLQTLKTTLPLPFLPPAPFYSFSSSKPYDMTSNCSDVSSIQTKIPQHFEIVRVSLSAHRRRFKLLRRRQTHKISVVIYRNLHGQGLLTLERVLVKFPPAGNCATFIQSKHAPLHPKRCLSRKRHLASWNNGCLFVLSPSPLNTTVVTFSNNEK